LLGSSAYADQFALFFANRFKVTRGHESVSTPARDVFYHFLRQLIATDRPYDEFVRELVSAAGEVDTAKGTQFFARWMDVNGPIQDSWDDITEKITTSFLGYKTECVSCHNGRNHLEKINLHLSKRTRHDFWQMSAFLSRMFFVRLSDDPIGFRPRIILSDRDYGSYSGSVPPTNPGCRPPRLDAVVTPSFFTSAPLRRLAAGAGPYRYHRPPVSPRHGKLLLGLFLRPRHRRSTRRLGHGPRGPQATASVGLAHAELASGIARSAWRFADSERLPPEAADPPDSHERRLSTLQPL